MVKSTPQAQHCQYQGQTTPSKIPVHAFISSTLAPHCFENRVDVLWAWKMSFDVIIVFSALMKSGLLK